MVYLENPKSGLKSIILTNKLLLQIQCTEKPIKHFCGDKFTSATLVRLCPQIVSDFHQRIIQDENMCIVESMEWLI